MSLSLPSTSASAPSLTDVSSTDAPTSSAPQSTTVQTTSATSLITSPSATSQPTSDSSTSTTPLTTDTPSSSSTLPLSTSSSVPLTTSSSSTLIAPSTSSSSSTLAVTTPTTSRDTQTTVQQTSFVATTIIITQSNGQQLTSTSTVLASASTSAGAASTTASSSSSSSSHTGAIVGGTIGGIAGLALVGALIWFLYKRNRSNRLSSHFDGNFDPDRIVARPPDVGLNLDDERDNDGMGGRLGGADIGAGVVSPFPISASTNSHGSSGQSYANYYSGSPASPPPMSQYSGEESGYPAAIFNPYAMSIPPRSPPPGSSSSGLGGGAGGMSAKEREARQNQLGVVNPDDRTAYLANGPTGVVQHQDAGPSEIPPAYDSWGAGASGSK